MRGAKLFVLSVILGCLACAEAQTYSIDVVSAYQPQNLLVTVPAHGKVNITVHVANTLDSEQVARIRATWGRLIGPALEQQLIDYETRNVTHSNNLFFLAFFGGNDKFVTTFDDTSRNLLETLRISPDTAAQMMDVFYKEAKQMHDVDLECYVDNVKNDRAISGNVVLVDLEGQVKMADANETLFYRALSSGGVFAQCADKDECPPKANVFCELTRKPTEASGTDLPTMPHPDFE